MLSPYALTSSLSFPSGLTVSGGGATITGNSSVTGTLSVSGTLSGAGIVSMLSPYALTTSLPVPYIAGNGIKFIAATGTATPASFYIAADPNYPCYCTGVAASGVIGNTTGGLNIIGNSTITGTVSYTHLTLPTIYSV